MARTSVGAALAFAIAAAPAFAQWGPVVTAAAPTPRAGHLLAFDAVANRTLLFGGNAGNEFWSYSAGVWTQLVPGAVPGARQRAAMASDPLTGRVLLYGGLAGAQFAVDETWSWDGVAWQQMSPGTTPGGLERHAMAFDLTRQVVVVFGGRFNSWIPNQALGGTWEWNGTDWTQPVPVQSPPGRCDAAMAFHPTLQQIVMFGGSDSTGQPLDDTWVYDGATWTQIATTGPRPSARVGAQLVPVLGRNLAVLVGGRDPVTMQIHNDTWEHDGTSWRQIANVYGGVYPPRAEMAVTNDLLRNRLVLFGGRIANGALQGDTWEYGAQWQPFGMGCTGSGGVPALVGGAPALLGSSASATIDQLPANAPFALLAVGLSRTQSAFGSLPLLLTSLGMPGCRLYTSAEVFEVVPAVGGAAAWSWQVPMLPALVGAAVHLQGVGWDPGANAMGLTTSNAATLVIGG